MLLTLFFGRFATRSDEKVLRYIPLFIDIFNGDQKITLPEGYVLNGHRMYRLLYMFSDGIYSEWCIFSEPNHAPLTEMDPHYTKMQERRRKDIERLLECCRGDSRYCATSFMRRVMK